MCGYSFVFALFSFTTTILNNSKLMQTCAITFGGNGSHYLTDLGSKRSYAVSFLWVYIWLRAFIYVFLYIFLCVFGCIFVEIKQHCQCQCQCQSVSQSVSVAQRNYLPLPDSRKFPCPGSRKRTGSYLGVREVFNIPQRRAVDLDAWFWPDVSRGCLVQHLSLLDTDR